jgi:iron complex outermembrane recepter protein
MHPHASDGLHAFTGPLSQKNHKMNKSRITGQRWLLKPAALAGSRRAPSGGPTRVFSLARLARLVACTGVLTSSLPAGAQDEPQPPPEASPEASPPAPEASAEAEPVPEDPPEVYEGDLAEVVVTGFRRSLGAALEKKQRAVGQVDAIVAEDIAEFPDLNLAESLQRIPGVAINRTNGEGSQITVRGLPGLYTRVRINGMEVRANAGNGSNASGSGGRGFDFNLFASELFNSIVVHKTATADLDEGSLGSTVDLNTARAFNYDEGWTFVAGATGVYNDLSNTVRPRLTGLVAYRDPGGVWGATASAAYQRVRLDTASIDTVNWQKAPFRSVNGVACFDDMGQSTGDPSCLEVADAFHPRIPRFSQDTFRGDRLGLTAGVQFRPTHLTEIRLDALYANYPTRNDQRRLGPYFRGNERTTDISNYTLRAFPDRFGTGNDSIIAANADNAWMRAEHVRLDSVARFHQIGLAIDQRFTDNIFLNAFAGTSRSESGLPHDTTVNYDNRTYNGFHFDYTNDEAPLLAFNGPNVGDPGIFVVPELRDRVGSIQGGFDTAELNLHVDLLDEVKLAAGVNYKRATYETEQGNRDGTVCALGLYDCDTDDDGTNDILGPPGDPALSEVVEYSGDAAAGSTTRWVSPVIDAWTDFFGYYNAPLVLTEAATNKVKEDNLGYYLQAHGEVMLGLGDMRLLYDAGARYVETRQESTGYRSGVLVTIDRPTYRDWLPSANTALWFTDELVLRLAAAKVMARPALGDLSPGAGVDSFGYVVNFQNPNLDPTRATALDAAAEWYFADGSLLSVAVFHKDIESFPIRQTRRGTFASTGLPRSVIQPLSPADVSGPEAEGTCGDPAGCWSISDLTNGPGSNVTGLEVGLQAPFRALSAALPPIIRDMGAVLNYTYVDSKADYQFFGNPVRERLIGLSNAQYNATLYYDDSRFSARASLAYRSDFLTGGPASQGNLWDFTEANTRLDASTSYNVNANLKISLEALNLTDAALSNKSDIDAERRNVYNKFGRTYLLGARLQY